MKSKKSGFSLIEMSLVILVVGVIIAGINPHELNQTSYCISANHIKEML